MSTSGRTKSGQLRVKVMYRTFGGAYLASDIATAWSDMDVNCGRQGDARGSKNDPLERHHYEWNSEGLPSISPTSSPPPAVLYHTTTPCQVAQRLG